MDRIELEGMRFNGRHGVLPAERENPQEFKVDIAVEIDLSGPGASDRLEDTLDYTKVRAVAKRVVEGEPARLLETLAERIAQGVLELPNVVAVSVKIVKRPVSMAPIEGAAVHIRRTRA